MKKKILLALIIIALCTCAFTACGGVEFKVNFVVDGAVYATIDTSGQEIIKMPENPTKEGYTFDGWYWDKDTWQTPFTANSLLDAPLSSDMNVYAKWKANVVNVENISLNKTEITLHENDVEYLTATVLPANATDTSVVWESSNSTIATVVGGKVTALRVGNATISAITNDGGKIATCNVYVEPILVESVNLNYTSLSLLNGESKTLTATVLPNNATEKGVNWSSSNSSIVTVENGTITAVGYGSATITVSTIDGNKTATCLVEVIEDKITFNTLSVEDETVYGKVSNDTTTFSFIKEIVEHGNATYKVYKEITCETEINSKSISLTVGDNTVYVLQMVGRDLKLYTVTVRRRPMYEVTFNSNGGTSVDKQVVEEDSFANEPITTRTGYTFDCWNYDFSKPITKNTTITASWSANTNTPYKVEYYLQNLENDNYTKQETVNKTGTTDTIANAEIKTFAHFTHKTSSTDSGNIAPNGSTVLKVYYTRNKYTVTFDGNGGTLASGKSSQTVKYGGSVTAPTFNRTGYTFTGYDKTNYTNISESFTVTANWKINKYTLTIVYDNGQDDLVITQDYNTKIGAIADPIERAGYDFISWDRNIPTTMPAENITIMATWQSIFTLSGNTITGLTSYGKNNYTELIIPSMIDDVSVTSIGSSAFYNCNSLTSVVIGDSVTSIGYSAFSGCSSLTSITLPFVGAKAGVTSSDTYQYPFGYIFGTSSYSGSYSATQYYYYGSSITNSTFYIPSSLKTVTITGGNILYCAFDNCSSLTSVVIGDSVTSIGYGAFYNCSKLTSVVIGDSVTSIGNYAFYNCSKLTSVVIPNSVTSIGNYAFEDCSKLTSVVIGDSVTSIAYRAFYNCSSLTKVNYLGTIDSWAQIEFAEDFYSNPLFYAENLYINDEIVTDVNITTATKISPYAFYNCDSLTSVEIGDSVTSIGGHAFYNCMAMEEINFNATNCAYLSDYVFAYAGQNGNGIKVTFGNSVTHIPADLFYSYDTSCSPKLTSVVIGDSVTSIGYCAFENCSSLTSIEIPDSVTSIGDDAFYNCSSLTKVNYLGTIDSWAQISFSNARSNPLSKNLYINDVLQTEITINAEKINAYAFNDCSSLTSVVIGDSVTSIGDYAFDDCSSLTSVVIGDSVTSIGYRAFCDCSKLTSIKYRGTSSQWQAITKDYFWDSDTGNYTITYNYTGN